MSLNAGDCARLIKPAKLYMCMQEHYKQEVDEDTAPGVRGYGSVPLSKIGELRYENWITTTTTELYFPYVNILITPYHSFWPQHNILNVQESYLGVSEHLNE